MKPRLTLRSFLTLALAASAVISLPSCVTPIGAPPLAETQPVRIDKGEATKTFALTSDWRDDGWVIKKGSMISFNVDGTGIMEVTGYDDTTPPRRSRLHVWAYLFGADGNGLFKQPNSDAGQVLHLHGTRKDCIATVPFAFDSRYFKSITSVTFRAGRDESLGVSIPPASSK